ncbi:MAG: hypothetical protein ACYDHC_03070 [Desulfuromonadaceae bacterium]
MDQAQTAHDPLAERVITQFWDYDPFFVTDDDIFDIAGTVDKDGDLATQVAGELDEPDSEIVRAEFRNRNPPAVKAFQRLDLA